VTKPLSLLVRIVAGGLLIGALVIWLVPENSIAALATALGGADPIPLLAALLIYPLITLGRAVRLRAALATLPPVAGTDEPAPAPVLALTRVAALHSVMTAFAPMRLGEVSLVWLLHRAAGTSLASGAALLIVLRLIDLVLVMGAGLLALAALPLARAALPASVPVAAAALIGLLAVLLLAPRMARGLCRRTGPQSPSGRLGALWRHLMNALAAQTPARMVTLMGWSLLIWGLIFLMAWLCANATAAPVGPAGGVAGACATSLAMVLPVGTFANAGTFEAAWVLALVPAGLEPTTALATGLLYHVTGLLASALMAGWALISGGRALMIGAPSPR